MSPHNMPGLALTVPRDIALLMYHHGARWGRVISAMLQTPYPAKEPWYALLMRVGGPLGMSGQIWRRQNLLPPLGFKPWTVRHIKNHNINYTTLASILSMG